SVPDCSGTSVRERADCTVATAIELNTQARIPTRTMTLPIARQRGIHARRARHCPVALRSLRGELAVSTRKTRGVGLKKTVPYAESSVISVAALRPRLLRVEALDALRGLFALSVAVYHLTVWTGGLDGRARDASVVLGVYAVQGFFIISGFC